MKTIVYIDGGNLYHEIVAISSPTGLLSECTVKLFAALKLGGEMGQRRDVGGAGHPSLRSLRDFGFAFGGYDGLPSSFFGRYPPHDSRQGKMMRVGRLRFGAVGL